MNIDTATKIIVWYDGESGQYVIDACWPTGPATEVNRVGTRGEANAIARTESSRYDGASIEDQVERPYRRLEEIP